MSYAPPSSDYDIFPNDFVKFNFAPSSGNPAGEAPAVAPRYGLQYHGGNGPTSVFSTAPVFQAPAPGERASSASSSAALSTQTLQSTPSGPSAPSSVPAFQDLTQLFQTQSVSRPFTAVAPPANRRTKRSGLTRRRGPNRRHSGSGYVDMMGGLPKEVQDALQQEYAGCCEIVKGKDASTVQKHRFTKRHFNKLDPKYQRLLPAFTCPAFVGLHAKCTSAKAGRYDSTERHCNNCEGFQQMRAELLVGTLYPFAVSREEFNALQKFRKIPSKSGKEPEAPALVEELAVRLLMMTVGSTRLPESTSPESGSADVPEDTAPAEESQSPSPSPVDPSPSLQPQQPEQFHFAGPDYDAAGDGVSVSQVSAATSWLDNTGTFNPAPQEEPPYGVLYPANYSIWPNMNVDPAIFGTMFGEQVASHPAAERA